MYRPLAFLQYRGKSATPLFPARPDIDRVRQMGREVLAWPHFVMDDDPGRAPAWGVVHSEVRYIQALLADLRNVGIDSVMGNLYLPLLQLPNTYAFGRLAASPDERPEQIIADFAEIVARRQDAEKLTDVMLWLENGSYWERQMPEDGVLPGLHCRLTREAGCGLAAEVRPNPSPDLPLPVSAEAWLAELPRSIARMTWAR